MALHLFEGLMNGKTAEKLPMVLMEQLAAEWEEALEDEFCCQVDLGNAKISAGTMIFMICVAFLTIWRPMRPSMRTRRAQ